MLEPHVLPKYSISPSALLDTATKDVIEAYLVFREHWALIDLVFNIESPKEPTRENFLELLRILLPVAATQNNPVLFAMFRAANDLLLDGMTEEELQKETQIRELCVDALLDSNPSTPEERLRIIMEVRSTYESGMRTEGIA